MILVAVAILVGVFVAATGRGGELAYEQADHAPLDLGPVSATDVAMLRPPTALWGYNMQVTDEALERIAQALRDRDRHHRLPAAAPRRSGPRPRPCAVALDPSPWIRDRLDPQPLAGSRPGSPPRPQTARPVLRPQASADRSASPQSSVPRTRRPFPEPGYQETELPGARVPQESRPVSDQGPVPGPDGALRCPWALSAPEYLAYHDEEWGRPVRGDAAIFERLCLEAFQSGLSWLTILRKRENFRAAFAGFDAAAVARFGDQDVARLLADRGHRTQPREDQRGDHQRAGRGRPDRRADRAGLEVRGPGRRRAAHAGRRAARHPGVQGAGRRAEAATASPSPAR